MNQSHFEPEHKQADSPEQHRTGRSRLPLFMLLGSLAVGVIWLFQQHHLRQLESKIHQLQQTTNRISSKSITPVERVNLERAQISLDQGRIETQNAVYQLLFQGLGVICLGGLIYANWQHLSRTQGQYSATEDDRITARFSQAITHLASDKLEVRLGGIYTLERIAQESPDEHWMVIEVLTAFVREHSPQTTAQSQPHLSTVDIPTAHKLQQLPRIPTDVQAVLTILTRRDVTRDPADRAIELRDSNLRAADLNGVELWGADLWRVNLREAQLWQAKLVGAFLGRANLSEASLCKADLEGAYLWKANLAGANLSEANLEQANLEGSNLKGANLQQANLINADLRKVVGLTEQQLRTAIYDQTTQLPEYLQFMAS